MNPEKLRCILDDKHTELTERLWERLRPVDWTSKFEAQLDSEWIEYLNGLDCTVLDHEEILEDFEGIVNHSAQGRVCVSMIAHFRVGDKEEGNKIHILIQMEVAERALALGGLPPLPETERVS